MQGVSSWLWKCLLADDFEQAQSGVMPIQEIATSLRPESVRFFFLRKCHLSKVKQFFVLVSKLVAPFCIDVLHLVT